jgi:hypothetical protein
MEMLSKAEVERYFDIQLKIIERRLRILNKKLGKIAELKAMMGQVKEIEGKKNLLMEKYKVFRKIQTNNIEDFKDSIENDLREIVDSYNHIINQLPV